MSLRGGEMKELMSQTDLDNLADIIWWIKGFRSASDGGYANCPFGTDHIESLRKARINLSEIIKTPSGGGGESNG